MQCIIFLSVITSILGIKDRQEQLSEIESYELIHFNLDLFASHRQLEFDLFGENYKVELVPNENMITSEIHSSMNGTKTISCHYFGTVLEPEQSADSSYLSLSLCPNRGIRGSVTTKNGSIWIMPAAYYFDVEYDRKGLHRFTDKHLAYISSGDTPQFEEELEDVVGVSSRHLLGYNDENIVELYVLSDPGLTMRYRDEYGESGYVSQLKYYVMDLINKVSAEYKETNWGNAGKIQVAIAKLEIARDYSGDYQSLEPKFTKSNCQDWKNYEECQVVGIASTAGVGKQHDVLTKFATWVHDYRSSGNYDNHLQLVGHKILGINGVAYTGGMCRTTVNAAVTKGGHNSVEVTVRTIAHELGHNFGMDHDTCSGCIMAPYTYPYAFGAAAIQSLKTRFTQQNKLSCLRNGKRSMEVTVQSGGGGSSGGSSGDNGGSASCCESSNCNYQCKNAVKQKDSWCGKNAWDKTCKKFCKDICEDGSNGGGGSTGTSEGSGTCCTCFSNPSKSTCGSTCKNAVSSKDSWCGDNEWDETCENIAKKQCTNAELSIGETEDCIENTAYDQVVCVYNSGSLWNEDKEFVVIHNECLENKPIYQYRMDENVSYALYYNAYYEYVDSVEKSAHWIVALDDGVLTEVAQCDEHDLMNCGAAHWEVIWNVGNDSLQLIVDETMSIKNGRCQSLQENSMENSTVVYVSSVSTIVLFVIILAICGSFMYRRSKKLKMMKEVEVIEDHSEDEEGEEVDVDVQVEQTNLTETNA